MNDSKSISQIQQFDDSSDFENWINERPKWLQSAARFLIDNKRMPNQDEIEWLKDLCILEASGGKDGFSKIVPGALTSAAMRAPVRVNGINNISGVNAIKTGASLSLGRGNLSLIYGTNGTGKSGFARVLKQVCGSKAKDDLLGNVFEAGSISPSAEIEVSINGETRNLPWSISNGPLQILKTAQVFDTKTAVMYMGKNEASYEPTRMRFVSSLIKICDSVVDRINQEQASLYCKLPQIPQELASTKPIAWLQSISSSTKTEVIERECQFTKTLDDERIAAESALSQKDVGGRLANIKTSKQALERLKNTIDRLKQGLGGDSLTTIVSACTNAKEKRKIAAEDARKVFANADVEGVGQNSWMALWKHAKQFSEQHAYPGLEFPNLAENARCVLCQQPLDSAAATRMKTFKDYVLSGLESEAKEAERIRDQLLKSLPTIPAEEDWLVQMSLLKLPEQLASEQFKMLTSIPAALESANSISDIPKFDWGNIESTYLTITSSLNSEEAALTALQQDEHRQKLILRQQDLKALAWLNQNKSLILDERSRLISVSKLDAAAKLANTRALTRKNNELAESEISAGYQDRFQDELTKLGGSRLPVKPVCKREGKGKVTFGLTLVGNQTNIAAEKVLSEGEIRVVALAAFIADTTGASQKAPFIFDDPISSLDQDFEERVVSRLIELSEERQVIVFTHRLSFMALLESAVKKVNDSRPEKITSNALTIHIETLRRLGKHAGIVAKLSLRDSKPHKAASRIRNEFIPQLKNLIEQGNAEAYERDAWQVCSEFRILVEKCVENILLNQVLVRFRRDIQTKGRLAALTKIERSDCDLLDDLMTRYSVFEHSQSDQFPAAAPDISVIEQDLASLIKWIDSFSSR